ncbi:MAG: hypothetical protein KKB59_19810 [Spirochaetes bacterium]|nr:hypothetical protein [Spirochaetota bacterium]
MKKNTVVMSGICVLSSMIVFAALAGVFASTDYYTVEKTYNTDRDAVGPNIVFKVKEIRHLGCDRVIGVFENVHEAAEIAFEFQDKKIGLD